MIEVKKGINFNVFFNLNCKEKNTHRYNKDASLTKEKSHLK